MIDITVLYPNRPEAKFDLTYYLERHIPMVRRLLAQALRGVTVEHDIAGSQPGSPPAFIVIANLRFESVEAFQLSFGPHAAEIRADIPNYTNSEPIVQIGREVLAITSAEARPA